MQHEYYVNSKQQIWVLPFGIFCNFFWFMVGWIMSSTHGYGGLTVFVYLWVQALSGLSFSSVQLLSRVRLFATPWTAAHQASLSITNSRSLPKLISIESVMPSNHLCCPLLLLQSLLTSGSFQMSQFFHQVANVLELQLQHHSLRWILRTDFI